MVENSKIAQGLTMPDALKIRPMRSDEWDIFKQLDEEIFVKEDHLAEEFFQERVQKPGFFAMESETSELIGYLVLGRFSEEIAHLGRIGVRKSLQSQGLGSQLMEYALNWFQNETGATEVQLYTQVDNLHAQGLYNKFGFRVIGQTWHFFIPFKTLSPSGKFTVHPLQPDEYQSVANLFPNSLPLGAIYHFLERKQDLYTFKDSTMQIVGATRFTPSFPGCFPFALLQLSGFDDYAKTFQSLCDPPSDVLRITFHENEPLASLCKTRGYKLHHKLFRMQTILEK